MWDASRSLAVTAIPGRWLIHIEEWNNIPKSHILQKWQSHSKSSDSIRIENPCYSFPPRSTYTCWIAREENSLVKAPRPCGVAFMKDLSGTQSESKVTWAFGLKHCCQVVKAKGARQFVSDCVPVGSVRLLCDVFIHNTYSMQCVTYTKISLFAVLDAMLYCMDTHVKFDIHT